MTVTIFSALYLFLPAFTANAVPVLAQHVPGLRRWNAPVAARTLGEHKTWRGFVTGITTALFIGWCQSLAGIWTLATPDVHGDAHTALLASLLLGAGALLGDALKSAGKRRLGIASGRPLPIVDNVDYVLGGLLFLAMLYVPSVDAVLVLLVFGPVFSALSNALAYAVGWKKVWW